MYPLHVAVNSRELDPVTGLSVFLLADFRNFWDKEYIFSALIVVGELILTLSNQLLTSLWPRSTCTGKIPPIESDILRAPAPVTCKFKASKALRGGVLPAAAVQTPSQPRSKQEDQNLPEPKSREGEERLSNEIRALSRAAVGYQLLEKSARDRPSGGRSCHILIDANSQHFKIYFTEPSGLMERMFAESSRPSMDFCK